MSEVQFQFRDVTRRAQSIGDHYVSLNSYFERRLNGHVSTILRKALKAGTIRKRNAYYGDDGVYLATREAFDALIREVYDSYVAPLHAEQAAAERLAKEQRKREQAERLAAIDAQIARKRQQEAILAVAPELAAVLRAAVAPYAGYDSGNLPWVAEARALLAKFDAIEVQP